MCQLALEIRLALGGAGVGLGKIKGQRAQSVEHAQIAHVAAINGFNTNDADDDAGGYAIGGLGPGEGVGMLVPELHPGADANRLDKTVAVAGPIGGGAGGFGGWGHQPGHLGQKPGLGQLGLQPLGIQVVALGGVGDPVLYVGALAQGGALGRVGFFGGRTGREQGGREHAGGKKAKQRSHFFSAGGQRTARKLRRKG